MSVSHNERDETAVLTSTVDEQQGAKGYVAELWDWMKSILIALVIVVVMHQFGFNLSTVKGHSMEPTLLDGEWLFVNKIGYYLDSPERGDIVIFKDPDKQVKDPQYLVKRIVAVPGDRIEIHQSKLYINGEERHEAYTDVKIADGQFAPMTVQEGHFFVMGDNRHLGASKDSRTFGTIPEQMIEGKAKYILWPVSKWGKLDM